MCRGGGRLMVWRHVITLSLEEVRKQIDQEKFVFDQLKSNSAGQPDRELFFLYTILFIDLSRIYIKAIGYLFTFLPFYLFTFLPFYLFTFLPFYLFTFLPFTFYLLPFTFYLLPFTFYLYLELFMNVAQFNHSTSFVEPYQIIDNIISTECFLSSQDRTTVYQMTHSQTVCE